MEQVAANAEFQRTVLPGTLAAPRKASDHLWKLGSLDEETSAHLKGLVADFAGVAHGRGLRNVREAVERLKTVMLGGWRGGDDWVDSDDEEDEDSDSDDPAADSNSDSSSVYSDH